MLLGQGTELGLEKEMEGPSTLSHPGDIKVCEARLTSEKLKFNTSFRQLLMRLVWLLLTLGRFCSLPMLPFLISKMGTKSYSAHLVKVQ